MPKSEPGPMDLSDIRAQASADGHSVLVTDEMLRVAVGDHVRLEVRLEHLRRIQFDIERDRPATLVIVPDAPSKEPQVMMVLREDYESVTEALRVLGLWMTALND